jgi:hypothetical protein
MKRNREEREEKVAHQILTVIQTTEPLTCFKIGLTFFLF